MQKKSSALRGTIHKGDSTPKDKVEDKPDEKGKLDGDTTLGEEQRDEESRDGESRDGEQRDEDSHPEDRGDEDTPQASQEGSQGADWTHNTFTCNA